MHRQALRPSTNSSFAGIVNWQEYIKIYAYCWRKYNREGSLEHLTCFCTKTNVFWAKITHIMTKNYIQAWESLFSISWVTRGQEISLIRAAKASKHDWAMCPTSQRVMWGGRLPWALPGGMLCQADRSPTLASSPLQVSPGLAGIY